MSAPSACLRIRPMAISTPLWLVGLRAIMPRDLRAGRLPHARVPADIGERGTKGIDAMRHAGEIGVERDRHNAPAFRALAIEHVELPADHLAEFVGGSVRALEHRLVVDLVAVRHGNEAPPAIEAHDIGLVVIGPIADVFAALRSQEIERAPGLLQARAEPSCRPHTGRLGDGRERALDDAGLFARRRLVEPARVALATAHPLPAARLAL